MAAAPAVPDSTAARCPNPPAQAHGWLNAIGWGVFVPGGIVMAHRSVLSLWPAAPSGLQLALVQPRVHWLPRHAAPREHSRGPSTARGRPIRASGSRSHNPRPHPARSYKHENGLWFKAHRVIMVGGCGRGCWAWPGSCDLLQGGTLWPAGALWPTGMRLKLLLLDPAAPGLARQSRQAGPCFCCYVPAAAADHLARPPAATQPLGWIMGVVGLGLGFAVSGGWEGRFAVHRNLGLAGGRTLD